MTEKKDPRDVVAMLRRTLEQEGTAADDTTIFRRTFEEIVRGGGGGMFSARIVARNADGTIDVEVDTDSRIAREMWLSQLVHEGGLRPAPIRVSAVPVRKPGRAKRFALLGFDDGDIARPYAELSWVHPDELTDAIADGRVDASVKDGRVVIHIGGRQRKIEDEPQHHALLQLVAAKGMALIARGINDHPLLSEMVILASDQIGGPIDGEVVGDPGQFVVVQVLTRKDAVAAVRPHSPETAADIESEPPTGSCWVVLLADGRFLVAFLNCPPSQPPVVPRSRPS